MGRITRPRRQRRLSHALLPLLAAVALLLQPSPSGAEHLPRLAMLLADHAQRVAEHGHSHGLEEDLAQGLMAAMHGHSHDQADHDHGQAGLPPAPLAVASAEPPRPEAAAPPPGRAPPVLRWLRPPRA
ncbi:hypothetical protein ACQ5SO_18765 [Rhodovulum sp. DZ06]